MINININFANIFRGCFNFHNNKKINDLHQLKLAMRRVDNKTKIQMILAKITNGKHHSSFLFHFINDNTFEITDFFGEELHQIDSQLLCRNIPLMNHNSVVSVLCVRSENLKKSIQVSEELIQLLTDIVVKEK